MGRKKGKQKGNCGSKKERYHRESGALTAAAETRVQSAPSRLSVVTGTAERPKVPSVALRSLLIDVGRQREREQQREPMSAARPDSMTRGTVAIDGLERGPWNPSRVLGVPVDVAGGSGALERKPSLASSSVSSSSRDSPLSLSRLAEHAIARDWGRYSATECPDMSRIFLLLSPRAIERISVLASLHGAAGVVTDANVGLLANTAGVERLVLRGDSQLTDHGLRAALIPRRIDPVDEWDGPECGASHGSPKDDDCDSGREATGVYDEVSLATEHPSALPLFTGALSLTSLELSTPTAPSGSLLLELARSLPTLRALALRATAVVDAAPRPRPRRPPPARGTAQRSDARGICDALDSRHTRPRTCSLLGPTAVSDCVSELTALEALDISGHHWVTDALVRHCLEAAHAAVVAGRRRMQTPLLIVAVGTRATGLSQRIAACGIRTGGSMTPIGDADAGTDGRVFGDAYGIDHADNADDPSLAMRSTLAPRGKAVESTEAAWLFRARVALVDDDLQQPWFVSSR